MSSLRTIRVRISGVTSARLHRLQQCIADGKTLDPARWETSKVEVFADGRLGHASSTRSLHGTRLGIVPVPSFDEIASQPDFQTKIIQADEFEAIWKRATGR